MKLGTTFVRTIGLAAVMIAVLALTGTGKGELTGTPVTNQIRQSAAPSTTPGKWEYRILTHQFTQNLETEANRLGEQGFEVIAFEVTDAPLSDGSRFARYVMVFRRPKS